MSERWYKDLNRLHDIVSEKLKHRRDVWRVMDDDSFIDLPDKEYEFVRLLDYQLDCEINQLYETIEAVNVIYMGFSRDEDRAFLREINNM